MARKVRISITTPDPDSPVAIRDYNTERPNESAFYAIGGYGLLKPALISGTEDIGNQGTRTRLFLLDGSACCGEFGFDELEVWLGGVEVTGDYGSFEALFAAIGKYLFAQDVSLLMFNALEDLSSKIDALNSALLSNGGDALRVTVIP